MILDNNFKLTQLIVQIQYPLALELWDRAGSVNRRIEKLWPEVEVVGDQVSPQQVTLKSRKVQIDTGISQSTVSLTQLSTIDQTTSQLISETFAIWRSELSLSKLTRVSTRALYFKGFDTLSDANKDLFGLGLCRFPSEKVFDQPTDSPLNTFDLTYRFEDEESFAFVRLRTEQVKLAVRFGSAEFTALKDVDETKTRLIIDFDRGLKKPTEAGTFRMEDWLKGFTHLLRRDLEKVVKG